MGFDSIYLLIYFSAALVVLLMVLQIEMRGRKPVLELLPLLVLSLLLFFLLGMRDEAVGADTNAYLWQYDKYSWLNYGLEIGMFYTYKLLNLWELPAQSILVFFAAAYLFFLLLAVWRWGKYTRTSSFFIFFSLISMFFFKTMGINVIRQGLALAMLICAFTYFFAAKRNIWIGTLLIFLALSYHFTSVIAVGLFILAYFSRKLPLNYFLILYILGIILAALNIGLFSMQGLLGNLIIQEGKSDYLTNSSDMYKVGFKPQFVFFNSVFIWVFWLIKKRVHGIYYDILLRYFFMASFLFFMAFQLPYSDRWGLIGWIALPFLLAPVFSTAFPKKWMLVSSIALIGIFLFFEILTKTA